MMQQLRLLCLLVFLFTNIQFANAQSVFINEIHYDNVSADVNEAIEIAGLSGTDLTGWSLVLYNGSNSATYNTINLTGTIPNQQAGFGTVIETLPSNGLQNGAPDGVALVDQNGAVVQFLSYEGTITAASGAAMGLTSTDIGVSETSATPEGSSLQLSGTGTEYPDFSWQPAASSTYGAVNNGQSFQGGPPSVVINEFVFNHTGSDTDEFVEMLSDPDTDLSEYWLLEIEGDNNASGTIDEVVQLGTTNADGYFTTPFVSNQFENGSIGLLLVKNFTGAAGDDLDIDDDGIFDTTPWDEITDDIGVNDGGADDINYASVTLLQSYDGISFTVGGASRISDGTDTNTDTDWVRNDFGGQGLPSFPTAEGDNGTALNTPDAENEVIFIEVPVTVLINEIDADTEGTDILEFVELYDGGVGNAILDGYVIVFYNGSNNQSYAAYDLDGFTTDASGYFVLGNAAVPNVSIIFGSNGLQNGADAVALYQADATDFPSGIMVTTTGLIDAIVYDTNDSDDADLLVLLNEGEAQINEDGNGNKNMHSLQRFPNGEGGLRNTSTYTQAVPTPGASNTNALEPVTLIVNEVDADTEGTDTQEFIELFDGGAGNTSLSGFVVVLYNGNGDASYDAFDLDGFTTDANGYFVLGNTAVPNVSLVFGSNGLQNGADAVALYQDDAISFPNGTAVTTTNLVDALVYDTSDSDDTGLLVLLNAGQEQINEGGAGNNAGHSMQRIPNGEGGGRNTSTYTQEIPTPGVANGGDVTPGEIISILEARNAAEGTTVSVSGVLTVSDQFGGSAYIQDATGGIAIFDNTVHGEGVFNIGDSLTITGTRSAFNEQIQISPVALVENNGSPSQAIIPVDVTLAELLNHPAELVRVVDTSFPSPGQLLFGNANFLLTDASGSGELRIDNDVTGVVGLAQPENCAEITGVVGKFFEIYQLLPRIAADIPCAEEFVPGNGLDIPKDQTLDIVTWNIEWFGDEGNSPPSGDPNSDQIQKDSVKAMLLEMNADVYAVEEIADDALFEQMVDEMSGYEYVLSTATSRPNDPGTKQKIGFIYKTTTIAPVSTKILLETIHPLYNGGDASFLIDYPEVTDRFYASGRLPFMMTADVTINNTVERISFINIHARANSSNGPQSRYDMRKYDVEVLKDTLDAQYANDNFILLGDYNDDVDETVADISNTISSYEAYVNDTANYDVLTSILSDEGFRSFVFRENMIDHITISNELSDKFVDGSTAVHYEFYDSDYANTASDHLPVSTRLILKTLEFVSISGTDVSCFGKEDGTASVEVSGGIAPYTYEWSDGQTIQTATSLLAGEYAVTVFDAIGANVFASITITEPAEIVLTMIDDQVVYFGYPNGACATLSATSITGGTPEYTYEWSTGETTETIYVCPSETTTYSLIVTDANGCSVTNEVLVEVINVVCETRNNNVRIKMCYKGRMRCVPIQTVARVLQRGGSIGNCDGTNNGALIVQTRAYPNPFNRGLTVELHAKTHGEAKLMIFAATGDLVHTQKQWLAKGKTRVRLALTQLEPGMYILKTIGTDVARRNILIVKE